MRQLCTKCLAVLFFMGLHLISFSAYGHHPHDMVNALAISPFFHEDQTVFIAIGRHFQKSENKGASWKSLTNGIDKNRPVTAICISPNFDQDGVLYIGNDEGAIYKSSDKGLSWTKVVEDIVNGGVSRIRISPEYSQDGIVLAAGENSGFIMTRDGGQRWVTCFGANKKIGDAAFLPGSDNSKIIAGDDAGNLLISEDNGQTWEKQFHLQNCGGITTISVAPSFKIDQTIFIGTKTRGIYKSSDGGQSFLHKTQLGDRQIVAVSVSSEYPKDGFVFASTRTEAIFKSRDRGESWEKYATGLTTDAQADSPEYYSPHFSEIAISSRFSDDHSMFLAGFDGLFKSTDAGISWIELETLSVGLIKGMDLALNESDEHTVALSTYGAGAYISHNGGQTWSIINQGLPRTRLADIKLSPNYHNDSTAFSASSGSLLIKSGMATSWQQLKLKTDPPAGYRLRHGLGMWAKRAEEAVGVSDFISSKLFPKQVLRPKPYPTTIALSPSFEKDRTVFFGTRWSGVFKSNDGGMNNRNVNRELGRVIHLSFSPNYQMDQTLFANPLGRGVHKTTDGGAHWTEINVGLPVDAKVEQSDDIIVSIWKATPLLVSPNFVNDNTLFAGTPNGLYKSINRGEKWEKAGKNSSVSHAHIAAMGISPFFAADRTMLVSVWGYGLFRSTDGGTSFKKIALELINKNIVLEHIEFSPKYDEDKTIIAASEEQIFKSVNKAETWKQLIRPVRYENHRDVFKYTGKWQIEKMQDYSSERVSFTEDPGDAVQLDFVGRGIKWIGTKGPDHGIAKVFIDGIHQQDVDLYAQHRQPYVDLFTAMDLSDDPHNIRIEVEIIKNPDSAGNRVTLDAIDVLEFTP